MTKLQTQNSNNDEKTKAHLKWELNFSENTFDWKAIDISRFDICKDNKLQNFNTILYIETLQQTHTCLNVNILQDLYFQCISNIMETAPCETGPFKPHLYSKKGVCGGKVKIMNNVCNCIDFKSN